jgi:hypothetical protein
MGFSSFASHIVVRVLPRQTWDKEKITEACRTGSEAAATLDRRRCRPLPETAPRAAMAVYTVLFAVVP